MISGFTSPMLFDNESQEDAVAWSVMISGFVRKARAGEERSRRARGRERELESASERNWPRPAAQEIP